MLEAEARVREQERQELEAEARRSEVIWAAEISTLTARTKALEGDLSACNDTLRHMKLLLAQKDGEIASLRGTLS
jgi:ABC-type phosphate transport system auxiliary subunit